MKKPKASKRRVLKLKLSCTRKGTSPESFEFACSLPEPEAQAKYTKMLKDCYLLLKMHGFKSFSGEQP